MAVWSGCSGYCPSNFASPKAEIPSPFRLLSRCSTTLGGKTFSCHPEFPRLQVVGPFLRPSLHLLSSGLTMWHAQRATAKHVLRKRELSSTNFHDAVTRKAHEMSAAFQVLSWQKQCCASTAAWWDGSQP